ncbi:MAG: hypothetical protein ACJ74U_15985 [Jatrophihabitantaceae bacterium]
MRQPVPPIERRSIGAHRARITVVSLVIGLAIAALWSPQLVDDDIGVNVVHGLLGRDAATTSLSGTITGLVFAFVVGVAGTFTACNIAVFAAVAPIVHDRGTLSGRVRQALRPLGWLAVGALVTAGLYGAIGASLGSRIPQLSTATVGAHHFPVRLLQSLVVFGLIGLVMLYLGAAALGAVPDPLARLAIRWEPAPQVFMGVLIGGFLIGRPWPLFHLMFAHAAANHDAAFGAAAFVLVAAGNMLLMVLLFLLLLVTGLPRWLSRKPNRVVAMTAAAWLVGGSFTFVYWAIRLPARLGYGWFPTMPWH